MSHAWETPSLLLQDAQEGLPTLCSAPPRPVQAPPRPGPAPPLPTLRPGARTLVLILDGKAKDVACAEAGAVVHATVEEWVCVRVWDVQDLARGRYVARDSLVCRDADLIALRGQAWVGRKKSAARHKADHRLSGLLLSPLQTPGPQDHSHTLPPHGPALPRPPPRHRRTPWPPVHSDPAGTLSSCEETALVHGALTPLSVHPPLLRT